jgi:hypothetical protein
VPNPAGGTGTSWSIASDIRTYWKEIHEIDHVAAMVCKLAIVPIFEFLRSMISQKDSFDLVNQPLPRGTGPLAIYFLWDLSIAIAMHTSWG